MRFLKKLRGRAVHSRTNGRFQGTTSHAKSLNSMGYLHIKVVGAMPQIVYIFLIHFVFIYLLVFWQMYVKKDMLLTYLKGVYFRYLYKKFL